tara:strand:+ start:269 stop:2290 length:2022 start_codon:yes stop_codon:yes gene_type:complete
MSNPLLETTGLPKFDEIKPHHAVPALETLITAHNRKLDNLLAANRTPKFESIIEPIENMYHELNRTWSPISHLQSVLDSVEWREAYNKSLPLITKHSTDLLQNRQLHDAYQQVSDSMPTQASKQKLALLNKELRDFHLAGVTLAKDAKTRYKSVRQELTKLEANFDQNLQDATDAWHYNTTQAANLAGLPASIKQRAKSNAKKHGLKGWRLQLDLPNYQAVLTHADSRKMRETFYKAYNTRASDEADNANWDNSTNIEKILALRHEMAQLVGFENYAEYSLATKMASNVDEVINFLTELATKARPVAERELTEIQRGKSIPMQAWDIAYNLEKFKEERFSISDDLLRQYFPFITVTKGMFSLAEKLFNVSIKENPDVSGWHETVQHFEITDTNNHLIGSFYTDLFSRQGKRGGAWMDECVIRKELSGQIESPVGFLVCNFPPPDSEGLSLLTHTEVVTLFHEFGHMLHHLLTKVSYPSIAGINGVPWDGVELPSQFMENFAWCYEVLVESSGHCETGERLPKEMFEKMNNGRHFGEGLATLRQVEFALFDFYVHAFYNSSQGSRAMDVLREVRQNVAVINYPEFNRLPHSFSHIFSGGYAAGYYSYKWAEVMAADAFSAFEEEGILNQATAQRFKQEILEIGGSADFLDAYISFRGRKPTLDALLKQKDIGTN